MLRWRRSLIFFALWSVIEHLPSRSSLILRPVSHERRRGSVPYRRLLRQSPTIRRIQNWRKEWVPDPLHQNSGLRDAAARHRPAVLSEPHSGHQAQKPPILCVPRICISSIPPDRQILFPEILQSRDPFSNEMLHPLPLRLMRVCRFDEVNQPAVLSNFSFKVTGYSGGIYWAKCWLTIW